MIKFEILFYIIIISLVIHSNWMVWSENPIASILNLLLIYFYCAIVFLYLGAELLSVLLIVIYAGAVTVLFIFVIMMLNQRTSEIYYSLRAYLPKGIVTCYFAFALLVMMVYGDYNVLFYNDISQYDNLGGEDEVWGSDTNFLIVGYVLFNHCTIYIGATGVLLFVALIGTLILILGLPLRVDFKNYTIVAWTRVRRQINHWIKGKQ